MHNLNMEQRVQIRRARADESDVIAALYRRVADAEWPFMVPHTVAEDRAFFRAAFAAGPVWAAEVNGVIVGFCALRRGWIDHLFVAADRQGQGIGQALLKRSLRGRRRVSLLTFQRNARARAFYRQQGFIEISRTDGADNEEKEPDVRLEWRA